MPVAGLSASAVLLDLTMMDVTVTSPILMALLAHIGSLFPPSRVSIDLDETSSTSVDFMRTSICDCDDQTSAQDHSFSPLFSTQSIIQSPTACASATSLAARPDSSLHLSTDQTKPNQARACFLPGKPKTQTLSGASKRYVVGSEKCSDAGSGPNPTQPTLFCRVGFGFTLFPYAMAC
ncbi:hypothetical protein IWZ00DRAFT_218855 [Phyllosticta capitalensis]|uniref:Uncharacterized protein n=1 Tax=Phyllosticta capitalensis TaxID=121624 RepID=A0ABR1YS79_9PEZI